MRRSEFFRPVALLTLALFCVGATAPVPVPKQAAAAGYKSVIFSDDFSRADIAGQDKRSHRWYSGLWYKAIPPEQYIKQMDGFVRLSTLEGNRRGLGVEIHTLGRSRGQASTLFQFGYFEARIRGNLDPMNWGAFWLESESHTRDRTEGPWPRYCEIDIAEFGIRSDGYAASTHDWIDKKSHQSPKNPFVYLPSANISQWNVYGLLWRPGQLDFYFNNKLVRSIPSPPPCDKQKLFMIINAAKNGGAARQNLDVDWVHVFR